MPELLNNFHYLRPDWFWLLVPVLLASFALFRLRSSSSNWHKVIDPLLIPHLLDNPANNKASRRSNMPLVGATLALIIGLNALAGPSWERLPTVTEQKSDAMIIIADLTLSMHATDIKPSRLVRTRYKLLELLKQREEGQTALIAYSGDAHIVSPLTDDASTIAALVPSLTPEIMPSIGSNAISAFESAIQLLSNAGLSKAKFVWFTDEALSADQRQIRQLLRTVNSELLIIGVGTVSGAPVPLPSGKFVKDKNNQIVNAKLSRDRLIAISAENNGSYRDLQDNNSDIEEILADGLAAMLNSAAEDDKQNTLTTSDSWQDRGAYLALLLIPFALLSFRRGWILTIVFAVYLVPIDSAHAEDADNFSWTDLWQTRDQQAYALEQQQQHGDAKTLFEDPHWKAMSAFQDGDYDSAAESLTGAIEQNPQADANAHYNLGHALAHQGKLKDAIAAYTEALTIDPEMDDAQRARDIIESMLEQEKQQSDDSDSQKGESQEGEQQDGEQQDGEKKDGEDQEGQESQEGENGEQDQADSTEQSSGDESSNELLERQAEQAKQNDQQEKDAAENAAKPEDRSGQQEQPPEVYSSGEPNADAEQDLDTEQQKQLQQWLKKIPDDPAGLLRRKFRYERQVREREGKEFDRSEDGQLW